MSTPDARLYDVVRFRFEGSPEVVKRNLTLSEAQEHCRRDDTHGPDWFDGFDRAGLHDD